MEVHNYHFTINEIIKSLKNMNVINCNDIYYESTYTGSRIVDALNDVLDMEINKLYYIPKELNKKFQKNLK